MRATAELVTAAQAGDQSAFAELVRRYERVVTATAWSRLRDFHAAQDVAQESFVKAFSHLASLRSPDAFGSWLLKLVSREALHRAQRTWPVASLEVIDQSSLVDRDALLSPERTTIVEALARLPEQERVVVVFRYIDGLTVNDIATVTGRPIGTVTKQLSRAIHRLRQWLTKVTHDIAARD